MKLLTWSTVCVFLGIVLGWYLNHRDSTYKTTAAVEQLVETTESSEATEAARDVRTITLIESGETDGAIRLLCTPIAHYYYIYGDRPDADSGEQRGKLRVLIEDLLRTNSLVAREITNHMGSMAPTKKTRPVN